MSASSPPSSSPSLVPPPSVTPTPPSSLAPSQSQPSPTANTSAPSSTPSAPPPQSPPPTPTSPPPQPSPPPSQSPPPASTPPPASPLTPPPSPPPSSPPPAQPPPPPALSVSPSPAPPLPASSPVSASPPPSTQSPPPPSSNPSPPSSLSPPPPKAVAPSTPISPPPPAASPPPSPSNSPPPPAAKPPENLPSPPGLPSPAPSAPPRLAPTPSANSPPDQSPPPPRNLPQPVLPPTPAPPGNPTGNGTYPAPPAPSSITPAQGNATRISPSSNPSNNTNDTVGTGNPNSPKNNGIHTTAAVAIGFGVGFVVLSLISLVLWLVSRRKKKVAGFGGGYMLPTPVSSSYQSESPFSKAPSSALLVGNVPGDTRIPYSPSEPDGLGHSRSWFTYDELLEATEGFSEHNLLGEGGFGCVYKGSLPDGREVAVKQLKVGGGQGEREFRAEVEIISRVHHRHLVSLVGYCISEHQRLLVYEYVPNNTLHFHLHGQGRPVLDWATRLKVAAGAARGIAYLHEDCHPRIIHRDIKSSNILLDNNFDPKVSDFGLAKLALDSFTHVTTRVMGTFGYLAPEYASSGKLTEKSDVYSFGVVLLELITGRMPVDTSQPLGDESLVEWARPLLCHALDNSEFEGLIDLRLENNYVENEMLRMIEAAAACVRHSAAKRPRMSQVVRALDGISGSGDLSNGLPPGQSELFVSAQSAEIRMFNRMAFGSQDFSTDFSQNTSRVERES